MLFYKIIKLSIGQAIVLLRGNKAYNFLKYIRLSKAIIFHIRKNR